MAELSSKGSGRRVGESDILLGILATAVRTQVYSVVISIGLTHTQTFLQGMGYVG